MADEDVEQPRPFENLYCDYCEQEGHTFMTCPRRDDAHEDEYLVGNGHYYDGDGIYEY